VTPYVEFLQTALLAVSSEFLSNDEEGYTQSVQNRLETVDRHVQNDRYNPAANVLESIDQTVQQQVESGYDTAPSKVRPKSTIREMISFRVERLRELAETSSNGNGGRGR
jgi:hypothetical protein